MVQVYYECFTLIEINSKNLDSRKNIYFAIKISIDY